MKHKLKCQCDMLSSSSSPLEMARPVMLGVDAAATHCRSDKENDRQGDCRSGGDDDLFSGDLLPCGCKGGRQHDGDVEIDELKSSRLLL